MGKFKKLPRNDVFFELNHSSTPDTRRPNLNNRLRKLSSALWHQKTAILLLFSHLLIFLVTRHLYNKSLPKNEAAPTPSNVVVKKADEFIFKTIMQGNIKSNQDFSSPSPLVKRMCHLMSQCFPKAHFVIPGNPSETERKCWQEITLLNQHYHTVYAYQAQNHQNQGQDGERDVLELQGFMHVLPRRHADLLRLQFYNVCVEEGMRGRGLATRMMSKASQDIVPWEMSTIYAPLLKKNNSSSINDDEDGEDKLEELPRVLLSLDVDWEDKWSAKAFALYAKLGFTQWMGPCRSIYRHDFVKTVLKGRQDLEENGSQAILKDVAPAALAWYKNASVWKADMMTRPPNESSMKNKQDESDTLLPLGHFCMYKWDGEEWEAIGQDLRQAYFAFKNKANQ